MIRFQLFRPKIHPSEQRGLFESSLNRSSIFREIVMSRPSAELRSGHTWHIGNVEKLDKDGLYFAFGRTTKKSLDLWDDKSGDFKAVKFDSAPYTHVLFDSHLQLCAIAAKSSLSSKPAEIANKLQKLLDQYLNEQQYSARVEIVPLIDPQDFIKWLSDAFMVRRFSVQIARPNPFDAHKDFQEPLEKILEEANGETGNAVIRGKDLDLDTLKEISHSAAASGMDANATAIQKEGDPAVRRHMKDKSVTCQEKDIKGKKNKMSVLAKARQIYSRIHGTSSGGGDTWGET